MRVNLLKKKKKSAFKPEVSWNSALSGSKFKPTAGPAQFHRLQTDCKCWNVLESGVTNDVWHKTLIEHSLLICLFVSFLSASMHQPTVLGELLVMCCLLGVCSVNYSAFQEHFDTGKAPNSFCIRALATLFGEIDNQPINVMVASHCI